MRGRGIALEIKLYQKDSGQWWLEDRSLEKQLTPQRTKFSLFTKWKLIAECHFPSKILFYYSAGLNWMTYSYISTDSKLANKHKEFLPIRFFFFPWPVYSTGSKSSVKKKKKKSVFLSSIYHLVHIVTHHRRAVIASLAAKGRWGKAPSATSTSCSSAPTESQLGDRMQCTACFT